MLYRKEVRFMYRFYEDHYSLRGGVGRITTCTRAVRRFILFGRFSQNMRAITLTFHEKASIGEHVHEFENEIYITFDKNIRFNNNKRWRMINFCRKGKSHSAQNVSKKHANVYAFRF